MDMSILKKSVSHDVIHVSSPEVEGTTVVSSN